MSMHISLAIKLLVTIMTDRIIVSDKSHGL